MAITFAISWLLCTLGFFIGCRAGEPVTTADVLKCAGAGALIAVCISVIPGIKF